MSKEHLLKKRKVGICKAAWQLEDAIKETMVDSYPNDLHARELYFESSQALKECNKALVFMTVLTVFETPSWCNNTDNFFTYETSSSRCSLRGVSADDVLLSNLPYLPPGWGIMLELALMFLIARKLYLERQLQIKYFEPIGVKYNSLNKVHFGLVMVVFELVDCLVFVVFRPPCRLAFVSRTAYLCLQPEVGRLASCIYKVFFQLTSIATFYVVTVLFFAWIAATIFMDNTDTIYGEPANKGFDSFRSTVNTMFVAGSTEEFLYAFLPSYSSSRWSGLLWLTFLVVAKLLLLNLVLDTLVATYLESSEHQEEVTIMEKVKGIQGAFTTLSDATGEGMEVSKETFLEFAREFSKSPQMRPITAASADIVFAAVDADGSGKIDKREFCDICGVIEYDFWTTERDSIVKKWTWFWNTGTFTWFRERVYTGGFSTFMNYVLLLNLVSIIWESVWDLWGLAETALMENIEISFSLAYVVEVVLNLSVRSWGYYWSHRSNQFDFVVTWLLLASSLLDEFANTAAGADVKRYMNILRLLRLLRVLKQLKRVPAVQKMVQTISNLVTASKDITMLLGVVIFFFSSLGVQLWGGTLYVSNASLDETEYKEKHMFVLNFNDFSMAFGVWIVSLLCEYMPDISDAVSNASSIPGSWLVLVIFYVFGVSIVFELVKAFTIEVFVNLTKNWGKSQKEFTALGKVMEEFARRDMCLHYRVVGDLSTHEKVVEQLEEMDKGLEEEAEEQAEEEYQDVEDPSSF
mmetsp:Transcript_59112/g.137640  ORF Transcript_59112/g.137640 Transcript_59112/m.137640 type:complete len:749 (+) Transcript_59112:128-2374(+)